MQLVQRGAEVNAADNDGKTPLMYGAQYGHTEVAVAAQSELSLSLFALSWVMFGTWMEAVRSPPSMGKCGASLPQHSVG